ncbi:MAG: hypothetical protein ACXWQJ_14065 [Bdellovibrionota bacterium]
MKKCRSCGGINVKCVTCGKNMACPISKECVPCLVKQLREDAKSTAEKEGK